MPEKCVFISLLKGTGKSLTTLHLNRQPLCLPQSWYRKLQWLPTACIRSFYSCFPLKKKKQSGGSQVLSVWGVWVGCKLLGACFKEIKVNKNFVIDFFFFTLEKKYIGYFLKFSRQVEMYINLWDYRVEKTALSYHTLQQKRPSLVQPIINNCQSDKCFNAWVSVCMYYILVECHISSL